MFVVQSGDVVATHRITGDLEEAQEVDHPHTLCSFAQVVARSQ